jgi:hypothetical protein
MGGLPLFSLPLAYDEASSRGASAPPLATCGPPPTQGLGIAECAETWRDDETPTQASAPPWRPGRVRPRLSSVANKLPPRPPHNLDMVAASVLEPKTQPGASSSCTVPTGTPVEFISPIPYSATSIWPLILI